MVDRTLAGSLGLKGDWDLGEDNWKDDMDLNLLKLSVVVQGTALGLISVLPGTPAEGDVYLTSVSFPTHPNNVAAYDEGEWKYIVPDVGWMVYDKDAGFIRQFDGTEWAELQTGGGGGGSGTAVIPISDPKLVQVVHGRVQNGSATISLPAVATEGNLLLCVISGFNGAKGIDVFPAYWPVNIPRANQLVTYTSMFAAGTEQDFEISSTDWGNFSIYEISNAGGVMIDLAWGTALTAGNAGHHSTSFNPLAMQVVAMEHDGDGQIQFTTPAPAACIDYRDFSLDDAGNHVSTHAILPKGYAGNIDATIAGENNSIIALFSVMPAQAVALVRANRKRMWGLLGGSVVDAFVAGGEGMTVEHSNGGTRWTVHFDEPFDSGDDYTVVFGGADDGSDYGTIPFVANPGTGGKTGDQFTIVCHNNTAHEVSISRLSFEVISTRTEDLGNQMQFPAGGEPGQVLTLGEDDLIAWADSAGGPGGGGAAGALIKLAEFTADGTTDSVTFDNISQRFDDLVLVFVVANDSASSSDICRMEVNGNSGAIYSTQYAYWGGGSSNATNVDADTAMALNDTAGLGSGVNNFAAASVEILNYAASDKYKNVLSEERQTRGNGPYSYKITKAGLISTADPVESVRIFLANQNFREGSRIVIYGRGGAVGAQAPTNLVKLKQIVLEADTAVVDIPGIVDGYDQLYITLQGWTTSDSDVRLTFNGDTGGNYDWRNEHRYGSSQGNDANSIFFQMGTTAQDATYPSFVEITVMGYLLAMSKSVVVRSAIKIDNTGDGWVAQNTMAGWNSADPLNQLTFTADGTLAAGTVITVYAQGGEINQGVNPIVGGGAILEAVEKKMCEDAALIYATNDVIYSCVVEQGDNVAIFSAVATNNNGGGPKDSGVLYTIPAGKKAYVTRVYPSNNVYTNPSYFAHRIKNYDTSAEHSPQANGKNAPNGRVLGDGAGPILIGNAGETLGCLMWSSGDGNWHPQDCLYILTLVDE